MSTRTLRPETASSELPAVPLTIEGYSVLHQMMKVRWSLWQALSEAARQQIVTEALPVLQPMEQNPNGQSALFSLLGHKGDILLVHFRASFDALKQAELDLCRLRLSEFLEPTSSYLSVIELGLYESSYKTYRSLVERGIEPHSREWREEINSTLSRQKDAMHPRLFPPMPPNRYICFYPMDRRRGEVKKIISGSIGFDDWEWGVTLFADDPLIFKKLIYEMRFDEVSAVYALFGRFHVGVRCQAAQLGKLLNAELPKK